MLFRHARSRNSHQSPSPLYQPKERQKSTAVVHEAEALVNTGVAPITFAIARIVCQHHLDVSAAQADDKLTSFVYYQQLDRMIYVNGSCNQPHYCTSCTNRIPGALALPKD